MRWLGLLFALAAATAIGQEFAKPAGTRLVPVGAADMVEWPQPDDRTYTQWVKSGYWTWTDKQPYHDAVVIVQHGGGQGTGALIWRAPDSSYGLVATAAHVMSSGMGTVTWPSGYKAEAMIATATDVAGADGSLLWVKPPKDAITIPVSRERPQPGEYVEHCGYGGPGGNLRHFWATVRSYESDGGMKTNCYLLNGDSGGPVIYKGRLIGMNSGGHDRRDVGIAPGSGSRWPLHSPAICCGPVALDQMIARLRGQTAARETFNPAQCPPGQICYPRQFRQGGFFHIGPNINQQGGGAGPEYFPPQQQGSPSPGGQSPGPGFDPYVPPPPDEQASPQPSSPQPPSNGGGCPCPPQGDVPGPDPEPECDLDYGLIVEALIEDGQFLDALAADGRFRGSAGKDGQQGLQGVQGPPGPPGKDGPAWEPTDEFVGAVAAAVRDNLPPLSLALVDEHGKEIDKDTVQLGGTLKLQLYQKD